MAQAIKPLHDRIIVKRLECEEKTAGGIYIPDTAKEKAQQGQVIAVGAGKVTSDGNVKALVLNENDIVLFGKYSGTEVNFDGEDYLIMREEDVLAVLSK